MAGSRKRPFDFGKCKQRHIALKILYFGWDYDGLAEQATTDNTIEHHLLSALVKSCLIESRQKCNFQRCGRTDKGVSSYGQVVNLNVRSNLVDESQNVGLFTPQEGYTGSHTPPPPSSDASGRHTGQPDELNYVAMLNGLLPDHIRAIAWAPVGQSFSSRHSCQARTYSYIFPRGDLNIESMDQAARYLVGTHDFRNLCSFDLKNGVTEHVRTIHSAQVRQATSRMVSRDEPACDSSSSSSSSSTNTNTRAAHAPPPAGRYTFYELVIAGKGFLYHQIRCIMTVLFLVGRGREPADVVRDLLDLGKCPARPKYCPASPLPLSLFECHYDRCDIQAWNHDPSALFDLYKRLKQLWLRYKTKAVMIERVLLDIEDCLGADIEALDSWRDFGLEHDNMSDSKYVPLVKRPREDSLEHKLDLLKSKRAKRDEHADELTRIECEQGAERAGN